MFDTRLGDWSAMMRETHLATQLAWSIAPATVDNSSETSF
jgi:hypothetical protein